jgi:hypothetical protein
MENDAPERRQQKRIDVIRVEMPEMISLLEAQAHGRIHDAFLGSLQGNAYN